MGSTIRLSGVAPSGQRQPGGLKSPISSSAAGSAPRPGFEPGTYRLTASYRAEPSNFALCDTFEIAVRDVPRLALREVGWFHSVGLEPSGFVPRVLWSGGCIVVGAVAAGRHSRDSNEGVAGRRTGSSQVGNLRLRRRNRHAFAAGSVSALVSSRLKHGVRRAVPSPTSSACRRSRLSPGHWQSLDD